MRRMIPVFSAGLYLAFVQRLIGIHSEHILFVLFVLGCYFAHEKSRQFIIDFSPFALFGILYDFLKIFPKEWAGTIHVEWPYHLEKALFGFHYLGNKIIPNEFFRTHTHPLLDILTALAYSLHIVVPLVFGFYLWIKNRPLARRFAIAFFVANLLAFATYVALPVAPPWFVEQHGLIRADWTVPGNAAGLVNFDRLIGHPYFESVYAKSSWVHGAIPSMHAGFPLLVILFAHQYRSETGWGNVVIPLLYLFMILVWFSAIYLRHHYAIDLIAGALYVWGAFFIANQAGKLEPAAQGKRRDGPKIFKTPR